MVGGRLPRPSSDEESKAEAEAATAAAASGDNRKIMKHKFCTNTYSNSFFFSPSLSAPPDDLQWGSTLKVMYGKGRAGTIYDAKLIRSEYEGAKRKYKYYVHYHGWSNRYDEWIYRDRIYMVNEVTPTGKGKGKLKVKGVPMATATGDNDEGGGGGGGEDSGRARKFI